MATHQAVCYTHQAASSTLSLLCTWRLLQGSAGQIIEIGNLLCSLFWIRITQELHHLNWIWLCVVHFVLKHRHIPHVGTGLVGSNNGIKEEGSYGEHFL